MNFRKRHPPVGARPGTLALPERGMAPETRAIRFDAEKLEETRIESVEQLRELIHADGVTWVDVQGLGDEHFLRGIGDVFGLHPLALEDLVNVPQRPKAEEYADHLILITRMARIADDGGLEIEQVSIVVGKGWVLSVQERYGDVLDPVRSRLRDGLGPMRTSGADYLAYAIADTIVDAYYPVLESLTERIEAIEDDLMAHPSPAAMAELSRIRSQLVVLRRGIWPMREACGRLLREPGRHFSADLRPYLQDTFEHCDQLSDVVDSHRELVTGLLSLYLSVISNRTNDIMKVLTIMASIFIPLTFMAGIYGMNFENMPELRSPWAYPMLLLGMLIVAGGMLFWFRSKGWLGRPRSDNETG